MIDYTPLKQSLANKGLTMNDMRKNNVLNSRTIAKINRNESVTLATIEKICLFIDEPIENVVKVTN